LNNFNKPETSQSAHLNLLILPTTSTNTYDLTKILNKKKSKTITTIPELQFEIKIFKAKLQTLKQV
jgi:hypothetical protein